MKRIIAVFLMIVMLLSLSGCTGEEESSDSSALQTESVTEESSSEESSADNAGGQCRLKAPAGTADRRLKTWNP